MPKSISTEKVANIKNLAAGNVSRKDIASKTEVSIASVHKILRGSGKRITRKVPNPTATDMQNAFDLLNSLPANLRRHYAEQLSN